MKAVHGGAPCACCRLSPRVPPPAATAPLSAQGTACAHLCVSARWFYRATATRDAVQRVDCNYGFLHTEFQRKSLLILIIRALNSCLSVCHGEELGLPLLASVRASCSCGREKRCRPSAMSAARPVFGHAEDASLRQRCGGWNRGVRPCAVCSQRCPGQPSARGCAGGADSGKAVLKCSTIAVTFTIAFKHISCIIL